MKKRNNYQRIERIFNHAAALQQSGKLKNTIYCYKNRIYILNQDHTVLLKFPLRSKEPHFPQPTSFEANDYDSPSFEMKGDEICFTSKHDGYVRTKSCKSPQHTPVKIARLYKHFSDLKVEKNCVTITAGFLTHLDESLSHIEFKGTKKGFVALQRNIYSGSIITIKKDETKDGLLELTKPLRFEIVGMRTNDFTALFSYAASVSFYFTNKDFVWVKSEDHKMPFTGIISQCIYDQLGKV